MIIFDLDETLVHTMDNPRHAEVALKVQLPNKEQIIIGVNIRPYVHKLLLELSPWFEINVFTASYECYAKAVIEHLDPQNKFIDHVLYRDDCVISKSGLLIKDLRVFKDRDIKDIAIVDNQVYSFANQLENGVPIIPFIDNKKDDQLEKLRHYLKRFRDEDIRTLNHQTFHLHDYKDHTHAFNIIHQIFPLLDTRYLNKNDYRR